MPVDRKKIDYDKLHEQYIVQGKSTTEIAKDSLTLLGVQASASLVYQSLIRNNIPVRNKSVSVSMSKSTLDIDQSFIDEPTIEWIDGFLLGDGSVKLEWRSNGFGGSRFSFGSVEIDWTKYAMSKLSAYGVSEPKQYGKTTERCPNIEWQSRTRTHPDIIKQAERWYPNRIKKVPTDVRITPTSLLLWYLGDGSFIYDTKHNTPHLRFATCAFLPSDIENILLPKLAALGLICSRETHKNDICIHSESVGRFFELIGSKSPISCYDHKFNIPEWLSKIHLCQIVKDDKEKWRAIYYAKTGQIECFKSPGGHFLLFTKDQADMLRKKLDGSRPYIHHKE